MVGNPIKLIDFNSDNLITIWHPMFAGGKFIMNCLSLSKHCSILDSNATEYLLGNPDDYEYRLSKILQTLPPKDKMIMWQQHYEFHSYKFYDYHGADEDTRNQIELLVFEELFKGNIDYSNNVIASRISRLINAKMNFFAEARVSGDNNSKILERYLDIWPNSKIVQLINFEKFRRIAKTLKTLNFNSSLPAFHGLGNECKEKYDLIKGTEWPDWETFEKYNYNIDKVSKYVTITDDAKNDIKQYYSWHKCDAQIFNIDVDGTYFNKEKFFLQMKELYNWLGYDDFNEELLSIYYTAYMKLHKLD